MTIHRTRLHRSTRRRSALALTAPLHRAGQGLARRLASRLGSEQGDVPGWVLITLMTAGIVVALWAVASEQIVQMFNNAMAPFLDGKI